MLIFRLGSKRYKVHKDWGNLTNPHSFKNISAITTNPNGEVLVLQRSQPFLLIFTKDGEWIDSWKNEAVVDGHYLHVTPDGKVIVVDRDQHRLAIFNQKGKLVNIIGESQFPGGPGTPFNHPTDLTITEDGHFYVADGYGNSSIHHFDHDWNLLHTWGSKGMEKGSFFTPHAIEVDNRQRLFIADRENNRVQIFDQGGKYIWEIGNVYHPMDICIDQKGFIYITDQIPSINLYNPEGILLGRCRTFGKYGHGITVDRQGSVYVAEMFPDGLTKLELIDK